MTAFNHCGQANTYLPFVRKIANRVARRLPTTVEVDDLVGAGTVGLMEALDRYDPAGGRSFETYAEFRVKGAILDELRRSDPLNRAARSVQSRIASKRAELTAELGRPPEEEEIAKALDVSLQRMNGKLAHLEACKVVSYVSEDQLPPSVQSAEQEQHIGRQQQVRAVREAIDKLSKREQMVLNLYYIEDLTQQQIGEVLDVSESRVCQILSQLRKKLRTRLEEHAA